MRVFIGPVAIGNYFALLSKALQKVGYKTTYFVEESNRYSSVDTEGDAGRFPRFLTKIGNGYIRALDKSKFYRFIYKVFFYFFKLISWPYFFFTCDIFIFSYARSLVKGGWDLPFYRLFGKKIIYVFVGSDVRPIFVNGSAIDRNLHKCIDISAAKLIVKKAKTQQVRLQKIEKYADVIINTAPMSMYLTKQYVQGWLVGVLGVKDMEQALYHKKNKQKKIRILHSPSNPTMKGTHKIREMIARLAKRYDFDWVELTECSNEMVLEELAKCDFVVDQLYSDTPMALFATEAAWYGKPAIVGGYWASEINKEVPLNKTPPSVFVHPNKVEAAIEKLIVDSPYRIELGEKAREYVSQYWTTKQVGLNWKKILDGDIPKEWFREPTSTYVQGACIDEDNAKNIIKYLVTNFGSSALAMDHKPELKELLLQFAGLGTK